MLPSRVSMATRRSVPAHPHFCSLAAVKELVTDANFDCTDEGIVRSISWPSKPSRKSTEQN
jgi:hypothetical protein